MNINNIFYEFPSSEGEEEFSKIISLMGKTYKNILKVSAVFLILAALSYFLYIFFGYLSMLICSVILLAASTYSFKKTSSRENLHALKIKAGDELMELDYYYLNKHKKLTLYYSDITLARFNDKDYTSFQIAFDNSGKSEVRNFNAKGNKIDSSDCIFIFKINPHSYEQAFFLYFANDYFDIKDFKFTKKLERKFGTVEEYLEKLQ